MWCRQRNFTEITLQHGWPLVNLHIFRTPFLKFTSGGLTRLRFWTVTSRNSHESCSIKKLSKNFAIFTVKHLCWSLLFNKVADFQETCKFIKKRLQLMCFPVNFAKFLKYLFLRTSVNDCFWSSNHNKVTVVRSIGFLPVFSSYAKSCGVVSTKTFCRSALSILYTLLAEIILTSFCWLTYRKQKLIQRNT